MKLLFANCEKSVSLEPPQWVEMAHDNRDNERPERTRGVVRGEYGVGSSAGALYRNWRPHGQPARASTCRVGKAPAPPASAAALEPFAARGHPDHAHPAPWPSVSSGRAEWSLAWWVPEPLLWASSTSVFSVSQRLNRLPPKSLARWAAWRNFISSRSLPVSSSFHFCGIGCFFAGLQWREDAATRAVQRLRLVLTAGYARCRPISRRRTGQGTR